MLNNVLCDILRFMALIDAVIAMLLVVASLFISGFWVTFIGWWIYLPQVVNKCLNLLKRK